MLEQRIIACLDVDNGKVVKGIQFRQHEVIGDILPLAQQYANDGADELVLYDISASAHQRLVDKIWIKRIAEQIDIPFTVAGGIQSVEDAQSLIAMGATKISINSPALQRPELINELVAALGSDKVVIGIDSHYNKSTQQYEVYQFTGDEQRTYKTVWRTLDWVAEVVRRGAGEIVLNCMNQDGMRRGYDIAQLQAVRKICPISLVASGGAGTMAHVQDVFVQARVEGALLASALHKGSISIPQLRLYLTEQRQVIQANASNITNINSLAWDKMQGLLPCVVQNADTGQALMLGYMNREAIKQSIATRNITFFSRSKNRLWMKGESSGHTLQLVELVADCDHDALLALVRPQGPTCHLGTDSCWQQQTPLVTERFISISELFNLEQTIKARKTAGHHQESNSYTAQLLADGVLRCAQKVGEEGVEVALAGAAQGDLALLNESADLIYHLLVLLQARGLSLKDVIQVLKNRRLASQEK